MDLRLCLAGDKQPFTIIRITGLLIAKLLGAIGEIALDHPYMVVWSWGVFRAGGAAFFGMVARPNSTAEPSIFRCGLWSGRPRADGIGLHDRSDG